MRVVVLGAGIIGSSVAYEVAKAGAQVTVLDAGRIAGGASAASFAWTNATGKRPQSYFALNVAGMRAHLDLGQEFGHSPWFKQTGSLEWYSKESDWPAQKENADLIQEWGYNVQWIDKKRLSDLEPEIDLAAVGDSPLVYYPEEGKSGKGEIERAGPRFHASHQGRNPGRCGSLGADGRWQRVRGRCRRQLYR